jgi:hypothetical protein
MTNEAQVITVTGTRAQILAALSKEAPKARARKTRPLSHGTLKALKAEGLLPAGWSVKEVLAGSRTLPTGKVEALTAAQRKVAAKYHAPTGAVRAILRDGKKG